jgi:hypothetical protein
LSVFTGRLVELGREEEEDSDDLWKSLLLSALDKPFPDKSAVVRFLLYRCSCNTSSYLIVTANHEVVDGRLLTVIVDDFVLALTLKVQHKEVSSQKARAAGRLL